MAKVRVVLVFCGLLWGAHLPGQTVNIIEFSEMINVGTASYIMESIRQSEQQGAMLIIKMDTPGGLLNATRDIVKSMLNAKVPIIVFVSPQGAHAGSAGVMITMAAHIAVMAPGTNIGAAHPVNFDGKNAGDDSKSDIQKKIVNDTIAFVRSIAKTRGRSEKWAELAVKDSESITSDEALAENVIDLIAKDESDLLQQLDNYPVNVDSKTITLSTQGKQINRMPMSLKDQLLNFLSHPNIAYMLMTFGGLGLYLELSHPGLIFPGVIGMLCVILSLICFQAITINYGALLLIFLGAALMIAELFVTSFGVLGLGGLTAFLIGSLFLVDSPLPGVAISQPIIFSTALAVGAIMLAIGYLINNLRSLTILSGNTMQGKISVSKTDIAAEQRTQVQIQGEIWTAIAETAIAAGQSFVVTQVEGMVLKIKPHPTPDRGIKV